jgi:hypothetical protein
MAYVASRLWWGFHRAVSRRWELHGVRVWYFMPLAEDARIVTERITRALALIAAHDPRQLELVRRHSAGIIVMDHPMLRGSWESGARLVRLAERFLLSDKATPARIATTVVHEVAHARLEARGFAYTPNRRHRIEAICYRAGAAFARRLPEGETLAEEGALLAQSAVASGPERWSPRAQVERDMRAMEILGVPAWLRRALRWYLVRRSA